MTFFDSLRQKARALLLRPAMPPPDPDKNAMPVFPGQRVVELQYSANRRYRSIIAQDGEGRFRVHRQSWDVSDWDVSPDVYWADDDDSAIIVDTLERARGLATEALLRRADG